MVQREAVREHRASQNELDELRAVVERDLRDAAVIELSADRRFATAYNAALQAGKMAIACCGYRVSGQGAHAVTFQAAELAMGPVAAEHSGYFEVCRRKRNKIEYDRSGSTSLQEVDEIVEKATEFLGIVEAWIEENYPMFSLGGAKS